jgi:hypothetical protein
LAALPVTIYKTDAAEKVPVAATTTDATGDYQFISPTPPISLFLK